MFAKHNPTKLFVSIGSVTELAENCEFYFVQLLNSAEFNPIIAVPLKKCSFWFS